MASPPKKKLGNVFEASAELEKERYKKETKADVAKQKKAVHAIFKQCEEMYEDLVIRIDRAFARSGLSESQFRAYFNRPQNFSKKEWELVQEQKKIITARLKALIPNAPLPKHEEPTTEVKEGGAVAPQTPQPKIEKPHKKPVTKRGWLKMT